MARILVSGSDFSPVIRVITWLLVVFSALAVIGRSATKLLFLHKLTDADDYFIVGSFILSIGQSAAVSIQASNGAGKTLESLNQTQITAEQKAEYSAALLYIGSVCLSRLAVLGMLRTTVALFRDRWKTYMLGLVIIIFTAIAELATASQCPGPHTWDYVNERCFNRNAWFNAYDVISISLDISLMALPVLLIWHIQTATLRKISIASFFMIRTTVVVATICDIVYRDKAQALSDPTSGIWPAIICIQSVQCLSIISACALYLKPLLETLESGFIRSDDLRRRGDSVSGGYGSYSLSSSERRTHSAGLVPSKSNN